MEVLSASSSLEFVSTQSLTSLADTPDDTDQPSSLTESVASVRSIDTQTEDDLNSGDTSSSRTDVKVTQWKPVPAPRRSITPHSAVRTLSASYSHDFESSSHTLGYSDDFETQNSRSHPVTSSLSAEYSDDFDSQTSYNQQLTSRRTHDYSEDFESATTFTAQPTRKSIELLSARTSVTYSESFESYESSERTEDESHHPTDISSAQTETAPWDSTGTTSGYSGGRVVTATRDSYMSESESSETESEESNTFTAAETYTEDTASDDTTHDEISATTRKAEAEAIAAFVARKLGRISGSRSEDMTPRPPVTPRPSTNGSTPRVTLTPRTPRVAGHPQATPRKSLDKESEEYCSKKIQLLRQKLSQPQDAVEESVKAKRWWDEVCQHSIEDYGFPGHKFAKLETESFLKKMEAVAKMKIHEPRKCPECKELAAEAQLRDFVKSKFAVVSEKHIQEKMKNPTFFLGDVITWLGESLQAMPRIHAPPKETLERLMRPLQDNYIMMKRVSMDVADEAARVCGAPTDRKEFWQYYMKRFYESPLYEAHCGLLKSEIQHDPEEVSEHIKKMRKETLRKLSQTEEFPDVFLSEQSETSEWEGSKSYRAVDEGRDDQPSEGAEYFPPEHSSTPHSRELKSALRSTSNSPSRMLKSRNVSFSDDSESYHPNVHNMAALQLSDSSHDGQQSNRSTGSLDSDSYKPNIYNIASLQLASSRDNSPVSPQDSRPPMSLSEASGNFQPNIYNIADLQLADSLDDVGGDLSPKLHVTPETLDTLRSGASSFTDSVSPPSDLDDTSYSANPVYSIGDL